MLDLLEKYDIKHFGRMCNLRECNKAPIKEIVIFEFDPRTARQRELVSLYFCQEHYNISLDEIQKKIDEMPPNGKILRLKTFSVGVHKT